MHKVKRAAHREAWYSDNESTNYDPFTKRATRLNPKADERPYLEHAVPLDQAPQKPPMIQTTVWTPSIAQMCSQRMFQT